MELSNLQPDFTLAGAVSGRQVSHFANGSNRLRL
jgi:hypothetical protein